MAEGDLSQLDKMAAGLMERKEAAAARAKLTPVKGEKAKAPTVVDGLPIVPGVMFPNDQPGEVVVGVIRELGRQIEHLTQARDALATLVGVEAPADAPETEDSVKAREFAADFAAKQREAQASAFPKPHLVAAQAAADAGGGPAEVMAAAMEAADSAEAIAAAAAQDAAAEVPVVVGWACPEHGTRQETKSRKGRDMVACGSYPSECQKFELPA